MKSFDYRTAINALGLDKSTRNDNVRFDLIPKWASTDDFANWFLPYLVIVGDSRERDNWIEKACSYYGIAYRTARKTKDSENLKEGDYTFEVFGKSYEGIVAYERKGSISELYNNVIVDRARLKREFDRFRLKEYKKVVLMIEYGSNLTDLIDAEFEYRNHDGELSTKNIKKTVYSTLMSWKQPNYKNFEIMQYESHKQMFWQMLNDMFYFFRIELKNEVNK